MQFFTLFFDCAPPGPADENPHRAEQLTVAKPIIYPVEKNHLQYYHQTLPSLKEFLNRAREIQSRRSPGFANVAICRLFK